MLSRVAAAQVLATAAALGEESLPPQVVVLPPTYSASTENAVFQPYDDLGGTRALTKVTVTVSAYYLGDYEIRNGPETAVNVNWNTVEWRVRVEVPDGTLTDPPLVLKASGTVPTILANTSAFINNHSVNAGPTKHVYTDAGFLGAFLGPNPVELPVSVFISGGAYEASADGGKTPSLFASDEEVGVTVSLQYTYVPEPGVYAMVAGFGLLGFAAWRRHTARR